MHPLWRAWHEQIVDVVARLDDRGALEVLASPEPGGRYYWGSNGALSWILENDAELLVWLADEVQEATMERDQVNVFVWPVCAVHQFGGHAGVVAGEAVWSCNGPAVTSLHRSGSFPESDGEP